MSGTSSAEEFMKNLLTRPITTNPPKNPVVLFLNENLLLVVASLIILLMIMMLVMCCSCYVNLTNKRKTRSQIKTLSTRIKSLETSVKDLRETVKNRDAEKQETEANESDSMLEPETSDVYAPSSSDSTSESNPIYAEPDESMYAVVYGEIGVPNEEVLEILSKGKWFP